MATLLDMGFFSHFAPIFAFLLVFCIVFAILESKKILGDHRGINSLVAFCVASLFVLSGFAIRIVSLAAPYFVVLFIFVLFVVMSVTIFGFDLDRIMKTVASPDYNYILYFVVIFGLVIILIVLGQSFGQSLLSGPADAQAPAVNLSYTGNVSSTNNYEQNLWNTVFHPKVLGLIFVLIIASFAMRLLAQKTGA